jgi:hypothetical protein
LTVASTAQAGQHLTTGDFNGDGRSDLAIGVPLENLGTVSDCGVVHVIYGRGGALSNVNDDIWHQNKPGIPDTAEFGDQFGRALAAGDFNDDGFDDLAISINEDSGNGAVQILYGANNGLGTAHNRLLTQETSSDGEVGLDNFGASLAVGDFDRDGFDDLAIGEPRDMVRGFSAAGSVTIIYGEPGGLRGGTQYWHQERTGHGVGDLAENFDLYGSALAAGDFDGDNFDDLAIGVPFEDIAAVLDTGIVQVLFGSNEGLTGDGHERWMQNSPGVADVIESGDQFGSVLAAGDFDADGRDDLAIGVPFEKFDSRVHTGIVHVLYGTDGGLTGNGSDIWHQNRSGIQDECERDDEFGTALAAGDFDGDGRDDLAIGAHGETFEGDPEDEEDDLKTAGIMEVLYGTPSGLKTTTSQFWHLDIDNVPGQPGDARFGSTLAIGDFDNDGFADVAVSAPGESVDGVTKAGAVHILYGTAARLTTVHGGKYWHQSIAGIADECEESDGLGGIPPP